MRAAAQSIGTQGLTTQLTRSSQAAQLLDREEMDHRSYCFAWICLRDLREQCGHALLHWHGGRVPLILRAHHPGSVSLRPWTWHRSLVPRSDERVLRPPPESVSPVVRVAPPTPLWRSLTSRTCFTFRSLHPRLRLLHRVQLPRRLRQQHRGLDHRPLLLRPRWQRVPERGRWDRHRRVPASPGRRPDGRLHRVALPRPSPRSNHLR